VREAMNGGGEKNWHSQKRNSYKKRFSPPPPGGGLHPNRKVTHVSSNGERHSECYGECRAADEKAPGWNSTPAVGVASASKGHRFYTTKIC
jgi:hypothetical protein